MTTWPRVPAEMMGCATSAMFGGLNDATCPRVLLPVVTADVHATYVLMYWLQSLERARYAQRIQVRRAGVADRLAALLDAADLADRLYDRRTWTRWGLTFAAVRPAGQRVPAKARYNPDADEHLLAVNPLHFDGVLWFHWCDLAAAILRGGPRFEIVDAFRLTPVDTVPGRTRVRLRGARVVDPARGDDLAVAFNLARADAKRARALTPRERGRVADLWKLIANPDVYGELARMDRELRAHPDPVAVWGPWGRAVSRTATSEVPGPGCWPPAAAAVCAGARLFLAMVEHAVTARCGLVVHTATDSVAILSSPLGGWCEEGDARALSFSECADLLARFDSLSPFGRPTWTIEHDSLDRQVYGFFFGANRYALLTDDKEAAS